eukprot:TRINITY_DN8942_c0_g1_i1.p2 TRINITY_DN8942_c0_g1~~TRINITY_DN8942_c0_g1_i1.p2  ORF type:complete len:126 (+),score=47.99 TRINITY_DN8942_c0_g1_i1:120-497(+)
MEEVQVMEGVYLSDFRKPQGNNDNNFPKTSEEIYFEIQELENSIKHLIRSNIELSEANQIEEDIVYKEAIEENKLVISGKQQQLKLLKLWLEKWKVSQQNSAHPSSSHNQPPSKEEEKEEEGVFL